KILVGQTLVHDVAIVPPTRTEALKKLKEKWDAFVAVGETHPLAHVGIGRLEELVELRREFQKCISSMEEYQKQINDCQKESELISTRIDRRLIEEGVCPLCAGVVVDRFLTEGVKEGKG